MSKSIVTTISWVNDFMHASQIGFSSLVLYFVECLSIDHMTGSKLRDVRKVEGIFFICNWNKLQFDLNKLLITHWWRLYEHWMIGCIIDYHRRRFSRRINNNFVIILKIICRYTVVIFVELWNCNKYLPSFIPMILYFKICKSFAIKKYFKKTSLYMCYRCLPSSCIKHAKPSVQIF